MQKAMNDRKDMQRVSDATAAMDTFSVEVKTDPFGHNTSSSRAYRRAERIAAAVYLITKGVPEKESIRASLRDTAHALVRNTMSLRSGFRTPHATSIEHVSSVSRELITLLRLLVVSGYVSVQNAEVVVQAVEDLVSFVEQSRASFLSEHTSLTRADMISDKELGHDTAFSVSSAKSSQSLASEARGTTVPKATSTHPHARGERHSSRRETILALLGRGNPLGIKDIAAHITDCGEKTVQRELFLLIEEGLVRKEGEKRWSRYSIITHNK